MVLCEILAIDKVLDSLTLKKERNYVWVKKTCVIRLITGKNCYYGKLILNIDLIYIYNVNFNVFIILGYYMRLF